MNDYCVKSTLGTDQGNEMNRFAVLVDAGYLLSQGVQILSNQNSKVRKDIAIHDPQGLINKIVEHAVKVLGNRNLLRVYWYDGVSGRLSAEQEALTLLPDVQFRPGTISKSGLQKGVDSKIMADLIELSQNHAISDAVLVTGDGDLVVGIDLAQRQGVRVAVLGIEDHSVGISHCQSFEVVCVADRIKRMGRSDIEPFLSYLPANTSPAARSVAVRPAAAPAPARDPKKSPAKKVPAKKAQATATPDTKSKVATKIVVVAAPTTAQPTLTELPRIVQQFIATANPPFEKTLVTPTGALGQALDAKVLKAATDALGRKPMPSERTALRRLFREQL